MLKINVDCNYNYLGPSKPVLTKYEVEKLGLQVNQRVIAYQDEDEWYGTIKFEETFPEPMRWYIELDYWKGVVSATY